MNARTRGCVAGFVCWNQKRKPDAANDEVQLPTEQVRTLGVNHVHGTLAQRADLWTRLKSRKNVDTCAGASHDGTLQVFPVGTAPDESAKQAHRQPWLRYMHVLLTACSVLLGTCQRKTSAQYNERHQRYRGQVPADRIFTSACSVTHGALLRPIFRLHASTSWSSQSNFKQHLCASNVSQIFAQV